MWQCYSVGRFASLLHFVALDLMLSIHTRPYCQLLVGFLLDSLSMWIPTRSSQRCALSEPQCFPTCRSMSQHVEKKHQRMHGDEARKLASGHGLGRSCPWSIFAWTGGVSAKQCTCNSRNSFAAFCSNCMGNVWDIGRCTATYATLCDICHMYSYVVCARCATFVNARACQIALRWNFCTAFVLLSDLGGTDFVCSWTVDVMRQCPSFAYFRLRNAGQVEPSTFGQATDPVPGKCRVLQFFLLAYCLAGEMWALCPKVFIAVEKAIMSYYDLSYRYKYEVASWARWLYSLYFNSEHLHSNANTLSAPRSCHGPLRPHSSDGGPPRGVRRASLVADTWRFWVFWAAGPGSIHQGRRQRQVLEGLTWPDVAWHRLILNAVTRCGQLLTQLINDSNSQIEEAIRTVKDRVNCVGFWSVASVGALRTVERYGESHPKNTESIEGCGAFWAFWDFEEYHEKQSQSQSSDPAASSVSVCLAVPWHSQHLVKAAQRHDEQAKRQPWAAIFRFRLFTVSIREPWSVCFWCQVLEDDRTGDGDEAEDIYRRSRMNYKEQMGFWKNTFGLYRFPFFHSFKNHISVPFWAWVFFELQCRGTCKEVLRACREVGSVAVVGKSSCAMLCHAVPSCAMPCHLRTWKQMWLLCKLCAPVIVEGDLELECIECIECIERIRGCLRLTNLPVFAGIEKEIVWDWCTIASLCKQHGSHCNVQNWTILQLQAEPLLSSSCIPLWTRHWTDHFVW